MNLYKEELKKFLKSKINLSIILVLVLLPILCISIMKWEDTRHQVSYDNKIITVQTEKEISDQVRSQLAGQVDEKWFINIEALLSKEDIYQNEDVKQNTIHEAYFLSAKTYRLIQDLKQDHYLPEYITKDLESTKYYYGPNENMKTYMEVFKFVALIYALGCLYLFGQLFNQEHHIEIMDLLKSCQYGYSKLMISKIMVAISVSFVLGIMVYATLYMSGVFMLDVTLNQTTAQFYESGFQIYNFGQINKQAFTLMLIAGVGSSMLATCMSSLTKKTTVSLGLCALIFILPLLIDIDLFSININTLFPSVFLNFHNKGQLMLNPWLNLNGHLLPRVMTLGGIYLLLSWQCIGVIYFIHCKKLKGVRR